MKAARAPEEPRDENLATSHSPQDQRREARDQLTLILSFFSRVDAKASALLAINTGMLAVLASNAPPIATMPVFTYLLAGTAAALIGASLWFLYRVALLLSTAKSAGGRNPASSVGARRRAKSRASRTCSARCGKIPAFSPQNSMR